MALRIVSIVSTLGLASLLFACVEDSSPTPGQPDGGTPRLPAPGSTTPPAPTTTPPNEPPVEPGCEVPKNGPTVHKGDVTGEEVWTADASPHLVDATVSVRNGAKLTIEPCAEVRLAAGASIQVAYPITPNTGALIAEGTAKRPIRFVGKDGARWGSVAIHAPGTARLAHATFDNGGGADFQHGATLVAYGDGVDGADPLLFVDNVTIAKSLGTGAWLQRGATFVEGSRELFIRESGSTDEPYPLEIEEHAMGAVPSGSYTGNAKDEILIDPRGGQVAGSGLLDDATLRDRGVPYHVGRSLGHSLLIGGRTDKKLVTLTIEAGVEMRFERGAALKVQHFTNLEPSTAALRALGTAAKPIVFRSAEPAPAAGDWRGIWFGGVPGATNQIDHVRIEHAGYDCGCILSTCSAIAEHEGAVIFTAQPPSAFITNTVFASVAGHGITQGFDGSFVDFRPTNEFGVTGCAQTRPRESDTTCPAPKPACD